MKRAFLVLNLCALASLPKISSCQDSPYQYSNYRQHSYNPSQGASFYYPTYHSVYPSRPIPNNYYNTKAVPYPTANIGLRSGFNDLSESLQTVNEVSDVLGQIGSGVRERLQQVEKVAGNVNKLVGDLSLATHGIESASGSNGEIAQRGFFDTGLSDIFSLIVNDFSELYKSLEELFTSLKNDLQNAMKWILNYPGFGFWHLIVNIFKSFYKILFIFPKAISHFLFPRFIDNFLSNSANPKQATPLESLFVANNGGTPVERV